LRIGFLEIRRGANDGKVYDGLRSDFVPELNDFLNRLGDLMWRIWRHKSDDLFGTYD